MIQLIIFGAFVIVMGTILLSLKNTNHKGKVNSNKFVLKVVSSWFSDDYVQFKYSTNGGVTWHYIYKADGPFLGNLDYDWEWERVSFRLGNGNFDDQLAEWDSLEKIKSYEAIQLEKYNHGVKSIKQERLDAENKKANALIRANSKLK